MATAAGVSTRTLRQIMEGTYEVDRSGDPKNLSKNLRGAAESLTRLSLFCDLQPDEVLREYGLDPALGDVKSGRDRILVRRTPRWALSDPVLERIYERPGEPHDIKVFAGILRWAPFVKADDEPKQAWAWKDYVRRLLGTVNPLWPSAPHFIETIGQAINALHSRGRDESDLMFGLYETAFRRTLGLTFVPVPGIGVPLGLVYANPRPRTGIKSDTTGVAVSWEDLLAGTRTFKALALKEEAGHLFLKGVCEFADLTGDSGRSDVVVYDEGHSEKLHFHFLRSIVDARDSHPRIFVADLPTCNMLLAKIRAPLDQGLTAYGIDDPQLREQYRLAAMAVSTPEKNDLAPVYPVSIAVRADAQRWEQLLKTATAELFQNSPHIVARAYALLLKEGGADVLRPLPLDHAIPRHHIERFWLRLEESETDYPMIGSWLTDAARVWALTRNTSGSRGE